MRPPRSRHVYVTEGEPRTRNLLDRGNDPLFNRNRKTYSSPFKTSCQLHLLLPPLLIATTSICGATTTKNMATLWPNAANSNVSYINWPTKESYRGSSTGRTMMREGKRTGGRGIKDADPPRGTRPGVKVPTRKELSM